MKNEVSFVASADYAIFTRPDARSDRVSYSMPTPSSIQGLTSSILGKPEMSWDVLQIAVLQNKDNVYPKTMLLKRNEVRTAPTIRAVVEGMKKEKPVLVNIQKDRTQRVSLLLRDVAYLIAVRPRILVEGNTPQKYAEMLTRRLSKGQFFRKPYFGCKEFACDVRLSTDHEKIMTGLNLDCGIMLHHLDYTCHPPKPTWFHAIIRNGIMNCDADTVEVFQ